MRTCAQAVSATAATTTIVKIEIFTTEARKPGTRIRYGSSAGISTDRPRHHRAP
jgi:hypothetical protein